MHEVEVKILQAEVAEGLSAGSLHVLGVVLVVPQFARHKYVLAVHSRGFDSISNFLTW